MNRGANPERSDRSPAPGRLQRGGPPLSDNHPAGDPGVCVLGGMLIDPTAAAQGLTTLQAEDFAEPRDRLIFKALATVCGRGFQPDATALAVRDELQRMGALADAGGEEYLARLIEIVPTGANHPYHAGQLVEERARRVVAASNGDLRSLMQNFGQRIDQIRSGKAAAARTLEEILEAGLELSPAVVAPRLAWRGRVTLLAALEKMGKSTFLQAAIASLSSGIPFLGEPCERGRVLLLCLDESAEDAARRLRRFGAFPPNVWIVDRVSGDPAAQLASLVEEYRPDLVVVDTLARFAADVVTNPWQSVEWDRLFKPICLTARDHDTGIVFLGHAKKSDGKYRDSTAIGASVDCILEMEEAGEATRTIHARARWPLESFSVRLVGDLEDPASVLRYELDSGNLSLDARVLLFIEAHPGCSTRDLRNGVTGRTQAVTDALEGLVRRGAVEDRGDGASGRRLFKMAGTTPEPPREPPPQKTETRLVPPRNHPGTTSGTGSGSHPYRVGVGNHPKTTEPEADQEDDPWHS